MLIKPEENLIKIYENSFRKNWDLEAVTDYGTTVTLTYGQIAERIAHLHLLFKHCGIQEGDRIAVMGKNNSNWVITYLATVTYGAVIVPILQDPNREVRESYLPLLQQSSSAQCHYICNANP